MTNNVERQVIGLIAADRISIPVRSMGNKLYNKRPKLAKAIDLSWFDEDFVGDRVYARIEKGETIKARGMKNGIEKFEENFPRHGEILRGYIAEEREAREVSMYFGVNDGCRLTSDDYMEVMEDLGFTEMTARRLYPELMNISRNLSRKRDEERSVLIG